MAGPFKMKGNPMQRNYGIGSPIENKSETDQEELTRLVTKRTRLKNKESKREAKRKSGKTVILGNIRKKINKKKIEKVQSQINANSKAQENLKNSKQNDPSAERGNGKTKKTKKTKKNSSPQTKEQHQNQGRTNRI